MNNNPALKRRGYLTRSLRDEIACNRLAAPRSTPSGFGWAARIEQTQARYLTGVY
jgi:hypothetical protein